MGCSIPGCPQERRTGTILSRDGETITVTILSTTTALGGTYGFVASGGPAAEIFGGGTP